MRWECRHPEFGGAARYQYPQHRITASAGWLRPESRRLVPSQGRRLFCARLRQAAIRTRPDLDRIRGAIAISSQHHVYGVLTTAPNAVVEPIHPKAMPVILTTEEETPGFARGGESIAAPPARS